MPRSHLLLIKPRLDDLRLKHGVRLGLLRVASRIAALHLLLLLQLRVGTVVLIETLREFSALLVQLVPFHHAAEHLQILLVLLGIRLDIVIVDVILMEVLIWLLIGLVYRLIVILVSGWLFVCAFVLLHAWRISDQWTHLEEVGCRIALAWVGDLKQLFHIVARLDQSLNAVSLDFVKGLLLLVLQEAQILVLHIVDLLDSVCRVENSIFQLN